MTGRLKQLSSISEIADFIAVYTCSIAPNMDTNDARESSVQQNDGVKSPLNQLLTIASEQGYALEDLEFARYMDKHDTLANLRNEFYYPKMKDLDSGIFQNNKPMISKSYKLACAPIKDSNQPALQRRLIRVLRWAIFG